MKTLKNFLLDLFFPKLCFGCQKENSYLCQDCQSLLDVNNFHKRYKTKYLNDLYYPLNYKRASQSFKNQLTRKLIKKFKYKPFVKKLSIPLSRLIIAHFQLCEKQIPFLKDKNNYLLTFVPLFKKRLKWRGYNQAEEITKQLSKVLKIPYQEILEKKKATTSQSQLSQKERKNNLDNVFSCKRKISKKILLIDDVYTTGATINECAKELKNKGAKKVIGITLARTEPD